MGIRIDADISLLIRKLNISESTFQDKYADMDLEEIVEKEAEAGNQAAVEFAQEIFKSAEMLVKIFQLANPKNKLKFLNEMDSNRLKEFLPLMDEEDLNQGLYYFDMTQLMKMLKEIPADQLVQVVFQMFSAEEVIEYLPEKQLDKFLQDPKMDKSNILKHLSRIPTEYLAQMYEAVSGENCEGANPKELIGKIGNLGALQFQDALQVMEPYAKRLLVLNIANADEELYEKFDADAYTNMMNEHKFQPEVVKAMEVIKEEEKIKMLEQLPRDLLSIFITQIDAKVFADKIIKDHPDLLAKAILS